MLKRGQGLDQERAQMGAFPVNERRYSQLLFVGVVRGCSSFFLSRTFFLQEVDNILLIYWQSPAQTFLYRWLWMCMNDTAKSKPQRLRDGW